jgi:hypothetical protein
MSDGSLSQHEIDELLRCAEPGPSYMDVSKCRYWAGTRDNPVCAYDSICPVSVMCPAGHGSIEYSVE